MTGPVLRTARLRIRPLAMEDVPRLAEIFSDPCTTRWLASSDLSTVDRVREWASVRIGTAYPDGMGYLTYLLDNTVVGFGHLRPSRELPEPTVETGWTVDPAYWGRGLAGEAAQAVVDFGLEELGLPAVWALVRPENGPSLRLAGRLGFREVATGLHYGEPHRVLVRLGEISPPVAALPRV
ncbi:RimJ/RimL family protein N-acetyltransferase [Crossiella equi]|uniref:RimJ/RimL family protein N-acetyltransferase n=1 Tax=Crossiella equi TaxID=130796 RepID=A0ABS5A8I7_9PSEU|nr:GNAT family N-acetyltransferase [Crossiella equi]MBP2472913.1 RimJ/RimL family protein N-acetyltransferase [Crossiella equi]